jgi:hypothetical protein
MALITIDQLEKMLMETGLFKEGSGDEVNHPPHYNQHPSGVEVITITEHMNFCRGNVIKYVLRAGYKSDELTDLRKAAWYLDREIKRLESQRTA